MTTLRKAMAAALVLAATIAYSTITEAHGPDGDCSDYASWCYSVQGTPYSHPDSCHYHGGLSVCWIECSPFIGSGIWCAEE